jgi:hypothetical protein
MKDEMTFNLRTEAAPLIWIDGAYRPGTFINAAAIFIMLLLTSVMGRTVCLAAEPNAHHDLSIELNPQEKRLHAVDEITIAKSPVDRLDFNLTRRAKNLGVAVNGRPRIVDFKDGRLCVRLAGFGFPSYTLIGGTVLRLPFIIHTSLGHEIAHCWWGNGVLVDDDGGNWSETLTTYVADYLYQEKKSEIDGSKKQKSTANSLVKMNC